MGGAYWSLSVCVFSGGVVRLRLLIWGGLSVSERAYCIFCITFACLLELEPEIRAELVLWLSMR